MGLTVKQEELYGYMVESLLTVPDQIAARYKKLHPDWRVGIEITQDMIDKGKNKYLCDDILWKCIKPHTTQENWRPSINTASIWIAINEEHGGTKEDPIPIPEQLTSFEYEWGLYYLEGSDLYLCNRDHGKPGQKYTLSYKPSQLVGHYFEKVEE